MGVLETRTIFALPPIVVPLHTEIIVVDHQVDCRPPRSTRSEPPT